MLNIFYFILIIILLYLIRKYINSPFTMLYPNMSNKIIIITGSSSGIGKHLAFNLLKDGANVIFACRNPTKTEEVFKELDLSVKKRAYFLSCDLSSFESVVNFIREFKNKFDKLDILINNAGSFPLTSQELSIDKVDPVFQSNHLSHMLMALLLLDTFDKDEAKILNISSIAYRISDYTADNILIKINETQMSKNINYEYYYRNTMTRFIHYGNTKIAQIYFSQFLGIYLNKYHPNIKIVSIHPGSVLTDFMNNINMSVISFIKLFLYPAMRFVLKSPSAGIQTQLHLCYMSNNNIANGAYYSNCILTKLNDKGMNKEIRDAVMKYSWQLIKFRIWNIYAKMPDNLKIYFDNV